MNTEEMWQGYDTNGEPTRPLTKDEAHRGALHGSAHVWLWRRKNEGVEYLIQKRSEHVITWNGFYDISAAGHIDAGERPVQSAIRETSEELAFEVQPTNLRLLFVNRLAPYDTDVGTVENEFQWVYGYVIAEESTFASGDGEVDGFEWATQQQLIDYLRPDAVKKLVPHGELYMQLLFQRVNEWASGKLDRTT